MFCVLHVWCVSCGGVCENEKCFLREVCSVCLKVKIFFYALLCCVRFCVCALLCVYFVVLLCVRD